MRELIHLGLELYYLCCPILLHLGAITNFCFFLLFEQEPLWPGMAVTALVFVLLSGTKKPTKCNHLEMCLLSFKWLP